ncbi:MAG: organic hydroperoxide resistance protein [Bordetella sp.]|nr:organic hydroperoxide resistance protein [Pseudomonadota bacterium]
MAQDDSKVIYTGKTHTSGGRDGTARSDDGRLDVRLTPPGGTGAGTNPEQLFAAGWSACFIGAMRRAAQQAGVALPTGVAVDAEVDLASGEDGFRLQARLRVSLPGIDAAQAREIVDGAHLICPYSKATRGNIAVELSLA